MKKLTKKQRDIKVSVTDILARGLERLIEIEADVKKKERIDKINKLTENE